MSVTTNESGPKVLPALTSTGAGTALLPNTGDSEIALIVALVAIVAGSAVLVSALLKRAAIRLSK